ncbi:MAG: tRNA uridine-5-carboxymethylaminomethyl(34) synthesis GTPase MnmE [Clostridiales bacterium]|nr:tRNA uridine-5-carboxymethylaminomethyl(34) synthesis GTPase MnmE [Clostridiales bacterium]
MIESDTIAAIATAMDNSGIGIIRISGDEAIDITDKIFKSVKNKKLKEVKSHTIHFGHIVQNNEILDEVLVSVMKAPNSYTKENVVEINCHGGVVVLNKVLETVFKAGARPAEPGEFTKRAFLNGRIDLTQAEAVIDIINSKNEYALTNSVRQLKGSVSVKVKEIRENILNQIAFIEAALDDPEHISLENYNEELINITTLILSELRKLLDSADNGRVISGGIRTVILGKPNAGKSSFLNTLIGEERAIVTEIEGTTRDALEENIRIHGISLNIADTAGIRETEDVVEKIGVKKSRTLAEEADLVLFIVDASRPLNENDYEIIDIIKDKKYLVLMNKSDLETVVKPSDIVGIDESRIINISAKQNIGIDIFEDKIKEMFFGGEINFDSELFITNERQKNDIRNAYDSILLVENSIKNRMPEDFFSIDLMNAYESLGKVIGETIEDDLVNQIFSKFCMGK